MSSISLTNVCKRFGAHEVIPSLDLEIPDGGFTVLLGPSGCGKSTILRMIAGLEEVSDGEIKIGDTRMNDVSPSQRGCAMVFQNYALYPHKTVRANLGFPLRMAGISNAAIKARVGEIAELLELTPLLGRYPRQLSGGQRQRVAMGRAMIRKPEVFLYDEPLSNLDLELRVRLRLEIAEMQKLLKSTAVYVTHDQTEAMTLADKVVVLREGRIEQAGPPQQLYHKPANTFVAGFIGTPKMNFFKVDRTEKRGDETRLWVGASEVVLNRVFEDDVDQIGIRPEFCSVLSAPLPGKTYIALDGAKLLMEEHLGDRSYGYIGYDNGELTHLVSEDDESTGEVSGVSFPISAVLAFDANGCRLD